MGKKEEKKGMYFIMIAPILFKHYFKDFKKLNAALPESKEEDEINPSSADIAVKKTDSLDISIGEEEKIL